MPSVTASLFKPTILMPMLPLARHSRFANIVTDNKRPTMDPDNRTGAGTRRRLGPKIESNSGPPTAEEGESAEDCKVEIAAAANQQPQQTSHASSNWRIEENWD